MAFPVLYSTVLAYDRWGQYAEGESGGINASHFWPFSTYVPVGTLLPYGPGAVFIVVSAGVSGATTPSLPFPAAFRIAANETLGTPIAWGDAMIVDATGYIPSGWDVCVGTAQQLLQVNNPTALGRIVGPCFQGSNKKVFIDSESTIASTQGTLGQGFNGTFRGLHLHRLWEVDSESMSANQISRNAAMSPSNDFIEYVSVDRLSPTAEKKQGAVYEILVSGPARGYGYVDGMVIQVGAFLTFGNFPGRNIMNLWFENCIWEISGFLTCDWTGTVSNEYANFGDDIDIVFSSCSVVVSYEDSAFRHMRGRWSFEGTKIAQPGLYPLMHFSTGYFEIDFKGCDLSEVNPEARLFDLSKASAGGSITLEECRGFSLAQLPNIDTLPYSRYTIDVVGGVMDGEHDIFRYIRISDLYVRERVRDVYRYSSPKYIGGCRVSDKCVTSKYMSPRQEFSVVTDFQIPVLSGTQKLTMYLMLPEVPDRDSLWVDISYPGEGVDVGFSSSREVDMISLSSAVWVGGEGTPYELSFIIDAGDRGNVLVSLYAAWPDKVFYVCPNIDVERWIA